MYACNIEYLIEAILQEKLSMEKRKIVKKALEDVMTGNMNEKTLKLRTTRVVGVTCSATTFPILDDMKYSIVILDECSQMLEPMSLLSTSRFGCKRLVMVGDPKQLPPPLNSEFVQDEEMGLGRTLFTRMADIGVVPIMLKRQYRLHPKLSSIVNTLFYDNMLEDGVTESDKAPLEEDIPTLLFIDTLKQGTGVVGNGGSTYNLYEAAVVVKILDLLLDKHIPGKEIGVIVFYKAQRDTIIKELEKELKVYKEYLETLDISQKERKLMFKEADSEKNAVQISTIDSFQGAEREIIIITLARTEIANTNFLFNPLRLNVAFTRARRHLMIIGKVSTLAKNDLWNYLIRVAKHFENGYQHASQILSEDSLITIPKFKTRIPSLDRTLSELSRAQTRNTPEVKDEKHTKKTQPGNIEQIKNIQQINSANKKPEAQSSNKKKEYLKFEVPEQNDDKPHPFYLLKDSQLDPISELLQQTKSKSLDKKKKMGKSHLLSMLSTTPENTKTNIIVRRAGAEVANNALEE